jgi:hypothetical protein
MPCPLLSVSKFILGAFQKIQERRNDARVISVLVAAAARGRGKAMKTNAWSVF